MKHLKTYESFGDNSMILYHGSPSDFDKFDIRHFNAGSGDGGWLGRGFYFTNDYSYAESYGNVKKYKINIENPYILNNWYYSSRPLKLMKELGVNNSSEIAEKLKSMGYDSVLLKYEDSDIDLDEDIDYNGNFIELCVFDSDKIETVEEPVNELFNSESEATVISTKRTEAMYYAQEILIDIKGITYRFVIQIKQGYMYFDFYIKDWENREGGNIKKNQYAGGYTRDTYNRYDFIVNDSMFLSVLNAIPKVFDAFVKEAVKDGLGDEEALAIYYDADEKRRERIYEYFFKKKLPNSTYERMSGYFVFKFEKPILLKDFKL
jgi:hypothetical protein